MLNNWEDKSLSEEITKLLDKYDDGKLPRRDLVKHIAAMTGIAGGLAGLLFGGKNTSAAVTTDLELRKIIIERITNTRYDGGGNTGNPVSGITAGRNVWNSEPELDPPYSAKERHRDWLLRRGPNEVDSFKRNWVAALERSESIRHPNDTPHPGKGANNIDPSDEDRIGSFIDSTNRVDGLDVLDMTDFADDPDNNIYEDVYHVLRRRIEVEIAAANNLSLAQLFKTLNGGDDQLASETKQTIRGMLEEPGDKWDGDINKLVALFSVTEITGIAASATMSAASAGASEDGDWY